MDGEQAAFLAAIREQPEDDLRRLVYADWLEERAGTIPCPACPRPSVADQPPVREVVRPDGRVERHVDYPPLDFKAVRWCRRCDGSGRVNNGLAERAEFIRVQIELAKLQPRKCQFECKGEGPPGPLWCSTCGHDPKCCNCDLGEQRWPFIQQQNTAFAAAQPDILREIAGWWNLLNGRKCLTTDFTANNVARYQATVRRGFVDEVKLLLGDWTGTGECGGCAGRGYNAVGWSPPEQEMCEVCDGTGMQPAIGPLAVINQPITRVDFYDSLPHNNGRDSFMWSSVPIPENGPPPSACRVPPFLLDRMRQDHRKKHESLTWVSFESEAVARDVLSDVAVAWAKDEASRASTGQGDISEVRS